MKGLHHSVIEINDTENSNIEKILVFMKPRQQTIDVKATRKEAHEILQKVKLKDRMPRYRINWRLVAVALWAIISTIGLLALFI